LIAAQLISHVREDGSPRPDKSDGPLFETPDCLELWLDVFKPGNDDKMTEIDRNPPS